MELVEMGMVGCRCGDMVGCWDVWMGEMGMVGCGDGEMGRGGT